jgi:hypothetical protein
MVVPILKMACPERLASTRRENRKAMVLDLKSRETIAIEMRKDSIAAAVNPYAPCKATAAEQRRWNGTFVFQVGCLWAILVRAKARSTRIRSFAIFGSEG